MKPHIPRRLFLELALSLLRRRQRSLLADTARMVAALPAAPSIAGREHLPDGPCVLVANHYQRRDLWIGWAGSLLIQAAGPAGPLVHLARAADRPPRASAHAPPVQSRGSGVRLRAGEVVGLFPEGERGHSGACRPPYLAPPNWLACCHATPRCCPRPSGSSVSAWPPPSPRRSVPRGPRPGPSWTPSPTSCPAIFEAWPPRVEALYRAE